MTGCRIVFGGFKALIRPGKRKIVAPGDEGAFGTVNVAVNVPKLT
jgi:hypothetical protein